MSKKQLKIIEHPHAQCKVQNGVYTATHEQNKTEETPLLVGREEREGSSRAGCRIGVGWLVTKRGVKTFWQFGEDSLVGMLL